MEPTISKQVIESVTDGTHSAPFDVLGVHAVNFDSGERLVLRAFRPEAEQIFALIGKSKPLKLQRISAAGLFEAVVPRRKNKFSYSLKIVPFSGREFEITDAYSFGRQISEYDLQLWGEGNHQKAYEFMGAHPKTIEGISGTLFAVSAPAAERVSVVGSFNNWDGRVHRMRKLHEQGLWELFIPHAGPGDLYKFEIKTPAQDAPLLKADPFAFSAELRPATASVITDLSGFSWSDGEWMRHRPQRQNPEAPISIYEVHAGSWKRKTEGDKRNLFLNFRELAADLIPYVKEHGFTHIELLPVNEHPYDPSWGYQITGYYAPTSRFGTPHDFMYFVNECHNAGIGVILDWVPAHFAKDEHGLRRFDGTALFEHEDPRRGEHKDWGTCIFNYDRTEVRNFLVSNAVYWCEVFHIDGLRADAVASMLYLDYSRGKDDWLPNKYGGRENLEAIEFLKQVNEVLHAHYPDILTFAEESTAWNGVTRNTAAGGLGFDFKWNMGWMNDILEYIQHDPVYRKFHHDQLTFSLMYAFSEHFLLPLSHDEVVHMKKSLLSKMPGDDWQKFANLRLLFTYMFTHPGKKLLFMGAEFGQWAEWNQDVSLDWHLTEWDSHKNLQLIVKDLNTLYKNDPALHSLDNSPEGFEWIDTNDADNSMISFIRKSKNPHGYLIIVLNFTPVVHHAYKTGVPENRKYRVVFNSDSGFYGGSNAGDTLVEARPENWHNQPAHIELTVPPLAGVILKPED